MYLPPLLVVRWADCALRPTQPPTPLRGLWTDLWAQNPVDRPASATALSRFGDEVAPVLHNLPGGGSNSGDGDGGAGIEEVDVAEGHSVHSAGPGLDGATAGRAVEVRTGSGFGAGAAAVAVAVGAWADDDGVFAEADVPMAVAAPSPGPTAAARAFVP